MQPSRFNLALSGPALIPDEDVKRVVIMLHGYGANGDDLFDLSGYMARQLPDTAFYCPHANSHVDAFTFGNGRQWYPLSNYDPDRLNRNPRDLEPHCQAMLPQAVPAVGAIHNLMDDLAAKHGIDDSSMALLGFSQGGLMAMLAGLMRSHPVAAVLGFSAVPLSFAPAFPITAVRSRPPVLLNHGSGDMVVPVLAQEISLRQLNAAGVPVQGHIAPGLGHSIDMAGLERGTAFLAAQFGIA